MTHREKRCLFSNLLCILVLKMFEDGYEAAFDEVTERLTDKDPTSDHMRNSKHHIGLAADINLYLNGEYLSRTDDHRVFGEYWESLHPDCVWGGRFNDGNHYQFTK